jgi:tetratricopeptide (TPR) repeat protein
LRGAIDWSHDLLDEGERRLFRRLAVFICGWKLDAAEAVCNTDGDLDTLGGLESLVSKSLARQDADVRSEPRFGMLETIREYALERLEQSGEEATLARRHVAWFADLAERGQAGLHGPNGEVWMARLAIDQDNLRAAVARSLADPSHDAAQAGVRMGGALFQFWSFGENTAEGQRWLEQVLTADRERSHAGGRAEGGVDGSAGRCGLPFPVARPGALGADSQVAALNAYGALSLDLQGPGRTVSLVEEAPAVAREVLDRVGEGHALVTLGIIARMLGEYERSVALFEESLSIFRALESPFGIWRALHQLGNTLIYLGDGERAARLLEESLEVARSMGHPWGIAQGLRHLGMLAYRQDDPDRALALVEESLARWKNLGATRDVSASLIDLGRVALALKDPRRATACFADSLVVCCKVGDRTRVAQCFEGLATVVATVDADADPQLRLTFAAQLLGAAAAVRETIGSPTTPLERPALDRAVAAARQRLGDEAFAAAWAEGRAMTLEQAVAYALDEQPSA